MKAPDKIYIAETPNKLIEIWSDEPIESKPHITEHEYIRKDTLLEYLQKEYEASKWFYEAHAKPGELHIGKCEAYKQVIDKI